jgi:hypothetical protein
MSLSIGTALIPLKAAGGEPAKAKCCAKMKQQTGDCGKHAPKPQKEKRCCAACAVGLATLTKVAERLVPPAETQKWLAAYLVDEHSRSERPPVPPPRFAFI